MNHPEISAAMPSRIAALERDERGYPIPYVVFRDQDGRAQFTVNDLAKVRRAIREHRCHICGDELGDTGWFVGGPGSALLNGAHAAYNDGPMHHECMTYALRVCPYLAMRMHREIGTAVAQRIREQDQAVVVVDNTTIPGTPDLFVALEALSYRFDEMRSAFIVQLPARRVEYWQHGRVIAAARGRKLAERSAARIAAEIRG